MSSTGKVSNQALSNHDRATDLLSSVVDQMKNTSAKIPQQQDDGEYRNKVAVAFGSSAGQNVFSPLV